MTHLLHDVRFALRSFARAPRLAVAAAVCIAVGVGATTAMLNLVGAALLRDLPYPHAERAVRVWTSVADANPRSGVSIPDFIDLEREAKSFELFAGVARERLVFVGDERAERLRGEAVSADYFAVTGVQPQLGRAFTEEESRAGGPAVVLIGDEVWTRWFGRDPGVIGRTIRTSNVRSGDPDVLYTIVGVMPAGYIGSVEEDIVEFWIPLARFSTAAVRERRDARVLWTLARLSPDATLADAQMELAALSRGLAEAHADVNARASAWVEPVGENWRSGLRAGLLTLQAAALLLLMIACINVANLMLARVTGRRRELAARQALGATRSRIFRQLLAESVVLAVAGGIGGLLVAWGIVHAFVRYSAVEQPAWLDLGLDPALAAAVAGIVAATGIAFGVLPALRGAREPVAAAMRGAGRSVRGGHGDARAAGAMVAVQIALTMLLLVGAGLLGASYTGLARTDLGYRTDAIARLAVSVNPADYAGPDELRAFYTELTRALEAEPGVVRAGLVFPTVQPWSGLRVDAEFDAPGAAERPSVPVHGHAVDAHFFDTMEMSLLQGRMIAEHEPADAPPIAVVSRSFAETIAPGGDPIGRTFTLSGVQFTVVGVAEDVDYDSALSPTAAQWRTEPSPDHDVYWSLRQRPQTLVSIAVHTAVDPATLLEPLTRRVNALAPASPVHWVTTMQSELSDRYAEARFYMILVAGFGLAALVLASVGLYALLANTVSRRTGEIGVRIALGARAADVISMLARQGALLAAAGLAVGIAVALAFGRALGGLLHGVSPYDGAIYATAAAFLATVIAIAIWVPARRAAGISPMEALRDE